MNSNLCKFWIIHGNHTFFYCGLPEGHKEDHQILIPKNFKEKH